jgi:hypothetical protein
MSRWNAPSMHSLHYYHSLGDSRDAIAREEEFAEFAKARSSTPESIVTSTARPALRACAREGEAQSLMRMR